MRKILHVEVPDTICVGSPHDCDALGHELERFRRLLVERGRQLRIAKAMEPIRFSFGDVVQMLPVLLAPRDEKPHGWEQYFVSWCEQQPTWERMLLELRLTLEQPASPLVMYRMRAALVYMYVMTRNRAQLMSV